LILCDVNVLVYALHRGDSEGTSQVQKLIIGRAMTGVNAMT